MIGYPTDTACQKSFVFISGCFSPVKTFDRNATACSKPSTGDCNFFKLLCDNGEEIQILSAQYVLKSNTDTSGVCPGNNAPQKCNDTLRAQCCMRPHNPVELHYLPLHYENLLKKCSWRNNCTAKAQYLKETSVLCEVSYLCVPGTNFFLYT